MSSFACERSQMVHLEGGALFICQAHLIWKRFVEKGNFENENKL